MDDKDIKICKLCRDQVFNPVRFSHLLIGSDYDEERGGIWLERSLQDISAGCDFCRIVLEVLSAAFSKEGERLSIRAYATCKKGRPAEDIQLLYFDIDERVHRVYSIFADADNVAAQSVSTRRPNLLVDSPQAFDMAVRWIQECDQNHVRCLRELSPLPTRVIDVTCGSNADSVVLFVSRGFQAPYVTLSYCWGAPQPRMLVNSNLRSYQETIDLSTLPRSIQDAIKVVRRIGLRYLWVDSLCIIQDSREDKNHEIAQMAQIYQNSYLTIVASSAKTCEDGFLARNDTFQSDETIALPYLTQDHPNGPGEMLLRPWRAIDDYDPSKDPTNLRAWIFQECILSPRLLTYPSRPHPLQWRCLMANKSNGGPVLSPDEKGMEHLSSEFYSGQSTAKIEAADGDPKLRRLWARVIQNYTSRYLAVATDKLPAMAGIASEFGRLRGARAGRYCAGIWRNDMPLALLWRLFGEDPGQWQGEGGDQAVYRAPSWSWASNDVQVVMPSQSATYAYNFDIIECVIEPALGHGEFGEVKRGRLVVDAMLKICTWKRHPQRLIDGNELIGEGIADSITAKGDVQIWCMPVLDSRRYQPYMPTGLLLEQTGTVFKRAGVMVLKKHDWFEDCTKRVLTIV